MSAKQTGLVWELNLPHNEAWVLMAMADHADHDGNNVYPGVPLLAWKTGYTTRQIRRVLAILQEKGLIIVEEEGGGRKTTRYRLDLVRADRKDPHRPEYARSRKVSAVEASEPREDKMSPLPSTAPEAQMSPHPGQNVMAARTQLCHPNRQGREGKESSIPPPSDFSLPQRPPTVPRRTPDGETGETGEGGKKMEDGERRAGEAPRTSSGPADAIWRAWAGWAGREALPAERRRSFDRQADRLASGCDLQAWTHPTNGAVVPAGDRPRIFKLGLQHLEGRTSRTLRGGVMYAVAKGYRTPPPVPGTEYAAVVARGVDGEDPGRYRSSSGPTAIVAAALILQRRTDFSRDADGDPVERWEREFPDESEKLREQIARQIAVEVGGRRISERTLLLTGRAQYRHVALQRIRQREPVLVGAGFEPQHHVRSGGP